jgi:hypothetical protein
MDNSCMIDEDAPKGKKGIKVKELAKELGLTSRALIDRCRAEGVFVQNSITKLDRAMEKKVRGWFKVNGDAMTVVTDGRD